jgi:hypothetical protein
MQAESSNADIPDENAPISNERARHESGSATSDKRYSPTPKEKESIPSDIRNMSRNYVFAGVYVKK